MRRTPFALVLLALGSAAASAQIPWGNDLEKGLEQARDRDAPILALLWDYN
ncbi:MAG: hypothetical protein MUC63_02975 [Planctomycetes bacterium]|jgi:hypothetical protein|nr:hypothetical protein [Planctomycetota bacterium]